MVLFPGGNSPLPRAFETCYALSGQPFRGDASQEKEPPSRFSSLPSFASPHFRRRVDTRGNALVLLHPRRIALGAEIYDEKCIGFVAPPGDLRQVEKPRVDNRHAGPAIYVSFAVHAHLELRSQVVRLVRVEADLNLPHLL